MTSVALMFDFQMKVLKTWAALVSVWLWKTLICLEIASLSFNLFQASVVYHIWTCLQTGFQISVSRFIGSCTVRYSPHVKIQNSKSILLVVKKYFIYKHLMLLHDKRLQLSLKRNYTRNSVWKENKRQVDRKDSIMEAALRLTNKRITWRRVVQEGAAKSWNKNG